MLLRLNESLWFIDRIWKVLRFKKIGWMGDWSLKSWL
jgi:hypothetical protein